jgi:hypothetical protein
LSKHDRSASKLSTRPSDAPSRSKAKAKANTKRRSLRGVAIERHHLSEQAS